ncbi:MAG: glycosyltransferase family 4 protein [Porticoccaceae bacterium]
MKIAFCLYKYFPYGGLQRDFLRIATECQARGHSIQVFVLSWQGEKPEGFDIRLIATKGFSSPARYRHFYREVSAELVNNPADVVVGFNKMPGLDIYYAADPCYAYKARHLRSKAYRLTSRYRHFSSYEAAVFGARADENATEILMISEQQQPLFQQYYGTPEQRFHLLPPGIDKSRCAPLNRESVRREFRQEFALHENQQLLLLIGSGFKTKGLDRILLAMQSLPEAVLANTRLFVIGQDDPVQFQREAKKLGIAEQVQFFSGRDDVPRFLQGADLLVHPAYSENTGTVLLEALVAGLPVLATANCGYAHFIEESGGGRVIDSPYQQSKFDRALQELITADTSAQSECALDWAKTADIYSLPERATDLIEGLMPARRAG